jgi:hypothetical protein
MSSTAAYNAAWHAAHREERKTDRAAQRKANPEKYRERDRIGRIKYAEKRRVAEARYRAAHIEERHEINRKWREANRLHVVLRVALNRTPSTAPRIRAPESADRIAARIAVRTARARGEVIRESCAMCDSERTVAHHFLGYAPEHRLDVIWLCGLHHSEVHHPLIREARRLAARIGSTDLRISQRRTAARMREPMTLWEVSA